MLTAGDYITWKIFTFHIDVWLWCKDFLQGESKILSVMSKLKKTRLQLDIDVEHSFWTVRFPSLTPPLLPSATKHKVYQNYHKQLLRRHLGKASGTWCHQYSALHSITYRILAQICIKARQEFTVCPVKICRISFWSLGRNKGGVTFPDRSAGAAVQERNLESRGKEAWLWNEECYLAKRQEKKTN